MSRFDVAIEVVLAHEGGYVDDPQDAGGATQWGISLRYLRTLGDLDGDGLLDGDIDRDGDVDAQDIRALTSAEAIEIYRTQWWDRYGYERIATQALATKVFDLAVNMGPRPAHRLLQQAYRAASNSRLVEDGMIGPRTLAAINNAARALELLAAYRSEAAGFYRSLGQPRFLDGWLNRAYA